MAEVGRNINNAYDNGYAAGFHFGGVMADCPYQRQYMINAWSNGLNDGHKDKVKATCILAAYNGEQADNHVKMYEQEMYDRADQKYHAQMMEG